MNKDGNANENVRKTIGLVSTEKKNTNTHTHTNNSATTIG